MSEVNGNPLEGGNIIITTGDKKGSPTVRCAEMQNWRSKKLRK